MAKQFNLKRVLAPVSDIVRKLKDRRDVLMAEVNLINDEINRLGGNARGRRGPKPAGSADEPKRRVRRRRSREQLETMAADVVKFINGKGKEGASATEIKSEFGDLLPSVNAWLKNYSTAKVKTTGNKSKMRYFA
jgi:hypothetical protein